MSDRAVAPPETRLQELERTCFVIMPFGKKDVGGQEVDFTAIYKEIFEPAIAEAKTPEDEALIPARTDMDAFSGSIDQDMFEYIMYSRMAFADISGFNPNVFYEIGARHSAQESGTVLFRQTGHAIPFDINSIKVFEYDHLSPEKAEESSRLITGVLTESLKRNRLDSPVRLALRSQWSGGSEDAPAGGAPAAPNAATAERPAPGQDDWRKREVERFMQDAEEATRIGDHEMARTHYWGALRFDPLNVIARMRLGLALKKLGRSFDALEEFAMVTKLAPGYGEAWREKGVIEGLIARKIPAKERSKLSWLPDGHDSLRRATLLIPNDFDAWSSLGGVLKNVRNDPENAEKMYSHAAEISDGHPYPLLNALKLEAARTGKLELEEIRGSLAAAERLRRGQTEADPPADTPWCFFDLAELRLYQGDEVGFNDCVEQAIEACSARWEIETFRSSLYDNLVANGIELPGLAKGIERLDQELRDRGED
jgi:tetratricopeptide (TPR) repeat protein